MGQNYNDSNKNNNDLKKNIQEKIEFSTSKIQNSEYFENIENGVPALITENYNVGQNTKEFNKNYERMSNSINFRRNDNISNVEKKDSSDNMLLNSNNCLNKVN